jgi:sulfatase maturation enzyme AslB (radical SAM superfamily)
MTEFTVSINPTYYCNFRCDFCYLTPKQLGDKQRISPEDLDKRLSEITVPITHVDLYGGEIGLLEPKYYYSLKTVIRKYYNGTININTNLSARPDFFLDDDVHVSVSYDFEARELSTKVMQNIMLFPKDISVLVLASPRVLETDVEFMINTFNMVQNIKCVEIKPYSTNQANAHSVTHRDFEQHVQRWIESPIEKQFEFVNVEELEDVLEGIRNAFSNDHVYITPDAKFGVLEFDQDDNEFFEKYNTFDEYKLWTKQESTSNVSDICKACEYYGKCLTEHYRYVKDLDNGCNGYKGLIDWYARLED